MRKNFFLRFALPRIAQEASKSGAIQPVWKRKVRLCCESFAWSARKFQYSTTLFSWPWLAMCDIFPNASCRFSEKLYRPRPFDALLLYEASLSILLPTTLSAAIYDRTPKYLSRAVMSSPGPRVPLNWLPCVERKGSRYIPHATKSVKKSARSEENWEHPPLCRILDLWYQHLQSLASNHLGV